MMLAECDELAERFDDDLLPGPHQGVSRVTPLLYQGDLPGAIELLEQARAGFRALGTRSASSTR